MSLFDVSVDGLFSASLSRSDQLGPLAQRALSKGLELFVDKRYDEAITAFKRAVGMAPRSDTAINAYDYMARSYVTLGDNPSAINAYKQALKVNSNRDDLHTAIGNIHYSADSFDEAAREYEQAVKINPSSANRYSLGQGYLAAEQFDDALRQFEQVQRMERQKPYGDVGLGQVYTKLGRYEEAIGSFDRAISLQGDYWDAYAEKGYTLVDMGEVDKAKEIADFLDANSSGLASNLNSYIYEKSAPKMTAIYASSIYPAFKSTLGPGTDVSNLGLYLSNPGDQQTFSMVFQFSKQMDVRSVENEQNWSIAPNVGTGRGDGYNYSMPLPESEVSLLSTPEAVFYDAETMTATVLFKIRQNDNANGTIDPSHIKFSFNGQDVLGLSMDTRADEYAGYSGFA